MLDWPPVLSDREVPKSCASSETGKLCIGSHSGVSILVTVIAAIIGHSELLITQPSHECFHYPRMSG